MTDRAHTRSIPAPPTTIGDHDHLENDQEVQLGVAALQMAHERWQRLPDHLPAPLEGSILNVERQHTRYERSDGLVITHRGLANDNLRLFFKCMINEAEGSIEAYPFGLYSLMRAAIESAATAMWLIQPETKASRVLRTLQISYRSAADTVGVVGLMSGAAALKEALETKRAIVERLTELKNTVGPLKPRTLGNPPKYTEILKSVSHRTAGPRSSFQLDSPILVWKISSAFIHNSESVIRSVSDIRQLDAFVDGVATFELTPSFRLLGGFATATVRLLEQVDARYTYLSTHDHGQRSLHP